MDWRYRFRQRPAAVLMVVGWFLLAIVVGSAAATNSACDWSGSGFSTAHENREVVSIFLRCTAGKIVWNYPRGAIRILLRKPMHLQDNFRACIKIYPNRAGDDDASAGHQAAARIYLEAPRRLIGLFGGDDDVSNENLAGHPHGDGDGVLVKCFRSINEQVALYVEAEETPFEITQTVFKYNLEFINNKHYSIRPQRVAALPGRSQSALSVAQHTNNADDGSHHFDSVAAINEIEVDRPSPTKGGWLGVSDRIADFAESAPHATAINDGTWWSTSALWRRWHVRDDDEAAKNAHNRSSAADGVVARIGDGAPRRMAVDEQITGRLGETYEICRPCTDLEMAHAYCSSDIVTRGTMFGIQQQPRLSTNEIFVNQTCVLRNNMHAILDAEDAWRHYQQRTKNKITRSSKNNAGNAQNHSAEIASGDLAALTFHTPLHCATEHEDGEFVFMGRRRFEEMMVVCAPRLQEWAAIVDRLNNSDNAPCILSS